MIEEEDIVSHTLVIGLDGYGLSKKLDSCHLSENLYVYFLHCMSSCWLPSHIPLC